MTAANRVLFNSASASKEAGYRPVNPTQPLYLTPRLLAVAPHSARMALAWDPPGSDRLGHAPTTGTNGVNTRQGSLGRQVLATNPHLGQRFLAGKGFACPRLPI